MKLTTAHTKEVWDSGDFVGDDRRPVARVTIQPMAMRFFQYRVDDSTSKQWAHSGAFACSLFGQENSPPRELFNVKSVQWSRGVSSDVGTCTIVLGNVETRNDLDPTSDEEMDYPGYYTPNRGTETYFDDWGYVKNEWRNWLVPDRIIRTYEGYGTDRNITPEKDPMLYPSGTWLIDDVSLSTDGLITLSCRDMGRMLLDQIMFPNVIPWHVYPLWFDSYSKRGKAQKAVAAKWHIPRYEKDSNLYYIGSGIMDGNRKEADNDGSVRGHHGRDACDGLEDSYWLSTGYRDKHSSNAYTWIQTKLPTPGPVQAVQINAQAGGYRVYISLQKSDGTWLGNKRVPYKSTDGVNTGANQRYVATYTLRRGEEAEFKLPKKYTDIMRIRYTFSAGWYATAPKYYRVAIQGVAYASTATMQNVAGTWNYGNYGDYSDIVKFLVCWGGFFWPAEDSGIATNTFADGTTETVAPATVDYPSLPEGRAWGDFEMTGTKGIAKFDVDVWDKKPLMDGIAAIREIIGFDFWIDETGGVIWRLPNIWSKGCYLMPKRGGRRLNRTSTLVEIDERKHLIDLTVKLSSKNVREKIYVGNPGAHVGAVVGGFHPDRSGLRRHAGWTDQHFGSNDEAERMGDMIALKQMFTYRQNNLTIAANPALQPDDQVIIIERMTGEGYIHRITDISSEFDNETGRWTYTLTTNWLGNRAFTNLAWDPKKLTVSTQVFLSHMGKI